MDSGSMQKPLHLFPNPVKDRLRFNIWVHSIGGDIIGLESDDIYKHRRVCHAHFEEKFCCRYGRLNNIATPTLNLPGPLALPQFTFPERRPLRQMQYLPEHVPSTTKDFAVDALATSSTYAWMEENIDPSVVISDVSNTITKVNVAENAIPELSSIIKESPLEVNVAEKIYNRCTKKETKTFVSKKIKALTTLEHDLY
ncbi:unnamed protein product [Parnassius mnemosyne]